MFQDYTIKNNKEPPWFWKLIKKLQFPKSVTYNHFFSKSFFLFLIKLNIENVVQKVKIQKMENFKLLTWKICKKCKKCLPWKIKMQKKSRPS